MDLDYAAEEASRELIGSPIGSKIVRAKAVRGGVKVKAEGTPMEIVTVAAVLLDKIMWEHTIPLHEVFGIVEELIREGDVEEETFKKINTTKEEEGELNG